MLGSVGDLLISSAVSGCSLEEKMVLAELIKFMVPRMRERGLGWADLREGLK